MKPVVSLEDLSMTERDQLTAITSKELKKGMLYYLVPCVILSSAAIYLNVNWISWEMDNDGLRGALNAILVIGALLPARLFVNKVVQHNKAGSAWKKKVIRGKIIGIEKNTLLISNQKVTLPSSVVSQYKVDDEVEIGLSQINDLLIYSMKK